MENTQEHDTDPEPPSPDHVVTVQSMMIRGLRIARFIPEQTARFSDKTNRQQFLDHFGASPRVSCVIYNDLQLTDVEDAKLEGNDDNLDMFLKALYFLRKYPKESQMASILQLSARHDRDALWDMVGKIQAMKDVKIVWPEDAEIGTDVIELAEKYTFEPFT